MTAKVSISLTSAQHAFIRGLVERGSYPSTSAVLQHGVELMRAQMERDALERDALATLLAERRAGGFVVPAAIDADVKHMLARKRRPHALRS
jgi:antitoxin ParD1/3/4